MTINITMNGCNPEILSKLPLVIWKDLILPFLDRSSWFALMAANRTLWRESSISSTSNSSQDENSTILQQQQLLLLLLPPWPKQQQKQQQQQQKSVKIRMKSVVTNVHITKEWLAIGCRDGSISVIHIRYGSTNNNVCFKQHESQILGLHIITNYENNNNNNGINNDNNQWLISQSQGEIMVWDLRQLLLSVIQRNHDSIRPIQKPTSDGTDVFATADDNNVDDSKRNVSKLFKKWYPIWEFQNPCNDFSAMTNFPSFPHSNYILCGHDGSGSGGGSSSSSTNHNKNKMLSVWKFQQSKNIERPKENNKRQKQQQVVVGKLEHQPNDVYGNGIVNCVSVSTTTMNNGIIVACGCHDKTIRLFHCNNDNNSHDTIIHLSNSHFCCWKAHQNKIKTIQFSPCGNFLASASLALFHRTDEATIRLWNLQGQAIFQWSPNDVYNISTRCLCFVSPPPHQQPQSPSLSLLEKNCNSNHNPRHYHCTNDQLWLVSAGNSGTIHFWDMTSTRIVVSSLEKAITTTATTTTSVGNGNNDNNNNNTPPSVYTSSSAGRSLVHDEENNGVYALAAYKTTLVSGGGDQLVRFWSID